MSRLNGRPMDAIPPAPDFRPRQQVQPAPCAHGCPNGADVRGWIGWVAQRGRLGLSREEAYSRAWRTLTAMNPLPATLGRICPHPCEDGCGRVDLDGGVRVHALERFLGDWALEQGLELPTLPASPATGSVAVIGAGPAGLSLAYQMARRGHEAVLYDANPLPGGMLRYAIPDYRLPRAVVDAEIQRILDLGVDLKSSTRVGEDVSLAEIRGRHDLVFLAIGAQRGLALRLEGNGVPVLTGIDYLRSAKTTGDTWLGETVLVVGGGNTAVDAARTARRAGSRVVVAYRRTREQMPALDEEVETMLAEGVELMTLVSPTTLEPGPDGRTAAVLQKMRLGPPDSSGRPRPIPVPDSERTIPVDATVAAVAQQVAWDQLSVLRPDGQWPPPERNRPLDGQAVWAGGDVLTPDLAVRAVADGRRAAEAMHAWLVGEDHPRDTRAESAVEPAARLERYETRPPEAIPQLTPEAALTEPLAEVALTLEEDAFLREAGRCLSCGLCSGCQRCWMYCSSAGFRPVPDPEPGRYYVFDIAACEACGKCVDVCPTGYIDFRAAQAGVQAIWSVGSGVAVMASTR